MPVEAAPTVAARFPRLALAVFVAVELGAAVLWLWLGSRRWFVADDWAFLADRDGGDLHDLFRPLNEHWSTVPVLIYRGLWNVVGLDSYVPYVVPVLAAHLAAAALLRAVMRRSGVDPWIATAAASAFALFGPGRDDIIWGVLVGFSGALALCLAAVVLGDHDGPVARRDLAGVLCCCTALLFTGVAVVLVATVALSVLLRRGWRVAAIYAIPPAALFLTWASTAGEGEFERSGTSSDVVRFVARNLGETVRSLGAGWPVGAALAIVLVVGLPLAVRRAGSVRRPGASLPVSLVVGAVAFSLTTALGRAAGYAQEGTGADASRYLHIAAALLLPALAVSTSAIAARWRVLPAALAVVFVVGVPFNVRDAIDAADADEAGYASYRTKLLVTAHLPIADDLPRDLPPELELRSIFLTMGWLADGAEAGRIPRPSTDAAVDRTALVADLALPAVRDVGPSERCRALGPDPTPLRRGQRLVGRGALTLSVGATSASPPGEVERFVLPGYVLEVVLDGYEVGAVAGDVRLCPPAP